VCLAKLPNIMETVAERKEIAVQPVVETGSVPRALRAEFNAHDVRNVERDNSIVAQDERVFARDSLTWTGYLLYGYWSFLWAAFGAFNPYLRAEFQIDYSTAALHFSALSLGPFLSGFFGDKLIRALGLTKTIASGLVLMMIGMVSVVAGRQLAFTIGGAFLIGYGGNIMSQSITTSMSNRFGNYRALGITEIQIVGSIFTLLAPLTVTAITKLGLDFRWALIGASGIFAAWFAANWRNMRSYGGTAAATTAADSTATTADSTATTASTATTRAVISTEADAVSSDSGRTSTNTKLPPIYWFFFAVIFLSVASEWTVAFWSTEFLGSTFTLSKSDAALCMSVFVTAMLTGRLSGSRLLRFIPETRLLALSATLAAGGFLLFWLARELPVNLIGLFLMGLGESNVYPLCLSRALSVAQNATAQAAARMSLSTGGSILIAPMCLGLLADKVGIANAYALVAVSLIAAAVAICFSMKRNEIASFSAPV